jgi:putative MATE family efflux protein
MKDLTQGSIGGHLAQMSAFIGVGMLVQTLYYLVDLYFVAGLGPKALAGVSTAGNVMFIVLALTQVLSVGTVTLIAHAVGRQDPADANLIFNQSLLIASICAGLMLLGGYTIGAAYVREISADPEAAAQGLIYLGWFIPCLALQFGMVGMGAALRGTGIVKPTMTVQSLTLILNTILAPVLIAGWGTGHPLGVKGAALASSLSIAVGVIMLVFYFSRLEHYVHVRFDLWRPNFPAWKRMFNLGLPAGGEFMIMFLVVGIVYWCIREFGAAAQAGFGIGSRVMQSIFLPAMAVAFAASPIAGQNFGARQAQRVRETFRTAIVAIIAIMVTLTLLCQWKAPLLVRAFTSDPHVIEVGSEYLKIISWNFVGTGLVFTCSGLFQAIGNTWPALLSSAARIVTFCVPAVWLSMQPWVRLEHFWYLSVVTIALQALFSLWLLRDQFRKRLAFAA